MLDPTVAFLIFSALIPVVMFVLKVVAEKQGFVLTPGYKQALAAGLSLLAVGLQVWFMGELPVFQGDSLAILKTAVAFFSAQMTLYELIYKRVFAAFE